MRRVKLVICLLVSMSSTSVFAQQESLFTAVQELFAAMSASDYAKMNTVVTEDFQLLEAGEVWDMDDLIEAIRPAENRFERRNYFSVVKTVAGADIAWISYWNKAVMKNSERQREIAWLESAVVVKVQDIWKIQLLHSTRVDVENIPGEAVFVEYTN